LTIDESGAWTFTANATYDYLNVGDSIKETFNVTSIDGSASTVTIQINGTNDAAIVSSESVILDETDARLSTTGQLTASDLDNANNSFTASKMTGRYGTLSIDSSGAWTFTANAVFNALNEGDSIKEVFTVTSIDGTVSTITIQIDGTREIDTSDSDNDLNTGDFDLLTFNQNIEINANNSDDITTRNALGLSITTNVDVTIDILGDQEQDTEGALSDKILLSVLSDRLTDHNQNDVVESAIEETQTFLQELASIWADKEIQVTPEITNFNTDNNPRSPEFLEELDQMQQDLDASAAQNRITQDLSVGAVTGVGITSAALFVSWLLRGGSLLASLLTVMPAWRSLDVLPILTANDALRNAQSGDTDADPTDASANIDALFEDQTPIQSPIDRTKR
jgi:VCBS repeat-containing protein